MGEGSGGKGEESGRKEGEVGQGEGSGECYPPPPPPPPHSSYWLLSPSAPVRVMASEIGNHFMTKNLIVGATARPIAGLK